MNEKVIGAIGLVIVVVIAVTCSGCRSSPVVIGGSEEIGELRAAYRELEERYSRLSNNYNELIERERRLTADYQSAADRIGSGLDELSETTGAISITAGELERNNGEALDILQQLIELFQRAGHNDSGLEEPL